MKHGNINGLRSDIEIVAFQLRTTRITFGHFRKKYGVSPYTLKRELLLVWSESKYRAVAKAKLAQGNEPRRWDSSWGIRGAAARKWKAVGTISIKTRRRKYGPACRRKSIRVTKVPWIKIRDGGTREQNWMRLADYNWIKAYGPIPEGHFVVSKNGDTMDCLIDNLVLVTKKTHILLNQKNFPGMSSRGAATLHLMASRDPFLKKMMHPLRKNISRKWECQDCGADYESKDMPGKCLKCGHCHFEKKSNIAVPIACSKRRAS